MTVLLVDVETQKAWMRSEIPTDDDPFLQQALESAQRTMGNALQRELVVATGSPSARSFMPSGTNTLFIHDCTSITSVVDNGTTLTANTDYRAEPLNGLSSAGEAWPYYRLRRLNSYWYQRSVTALVVVTAVWGWAAIPSQIITAIKIIAKDEFNQRDTTGFGLVGINEAGGIGTRENALVRQAVRDYSHPNAIGIA